MSAQDSDRLGMYRSLTRLLGRPEFLPALASLSGVPEPDVKKVMLTLLRGQYKCSTGGTPQKPVQRVEPL